MKQNKLNHHTTIDTKVLFKKVFGAQIFCGFKDHCIHPFVVALQKARTKVSDPYYIMAHTIIFLIGSILGAPCGPKI